MATYGVLALAALLTLFPLYWMLATSLKLLPDTRAYPPILLPLPAHWESYPALLGFQPFARFLANSVVVAGATVIGELLSCSFVAYGFARLRFPGRNVLFLVLVSTMMVPFIVRLVPLFLLFQQLKWINTYLPLIVPSLFGTPFFIFLMRQFYLTIPGDLAEAARIDGAGELHIWWRIYVPLSGPALAVVAIFAFQNAWNDFLAPLVFINDTERFTAALGLAHMLSQSGASTEYWNLLMAAATMTVVPVLALFVFAQRYFVRGVAMAGIRG
jgi:multiple sugar transport system permease protein